MKTPDLPFYQTAFAGLNCFKNKNGVSPNKPVLLLAVIDLIDAGALHSNLIPFDVALEAAYINRWDEQVKDQKSSRVKYPFFHLASEGFWRLMKDGSELMNLELKRSRSRSELRQLDGASLDSDLWELLQSQKNRETLRRVLLETYFKATS